MTDTPPNSLHACLLQRFLFILLFLKCKVFIFLQNIKSVPGCANVFIDRTYNLYPVIGRQEFLIW